MKKLLAALGLLLTTMAVAAFLLPRLVPQPYLQRQLGRLLAQETGLYLEQAERLRLSLVPTLGIAVEGVAVRLPLDKRSAPIIRADRIFTAIKPSSIFGRRLRVSKVVIENPSMRFHIDAAGLSNWDTTFLAPERGGVRLAALDGSVPAIKSAELTREPIRRNKLPSIDIDIVNGSFAYQDDVRGRKLSIGDVNLALRTSGAARPVTLDGKLRLQGQEVDVNASVTPPESHTDRAAPMRVALTSEAIASNLEGMAFLGGRPHFSGTVRVALRSGEALAPMIGGSVKALARFSGSAIAGRLDLSSDEFILSDATVSAPEAEGNLAIFADFDGTTKATLQNLRLHGGTAHGSLTLDTRQPDAILAGSFEMANVDSLSLTKGVSGFDWLSGRANVSLELGGGGKSLGDIAETLLGKARLSVSGGAIEGLDLPLIVAEAKQGKFKKWRREAGQRTPFDRLDASFVIEKGVASTADLSLTGPNVGMAGEGKTDLTRGRIDYRLKTKVTASEPEAAPAGDAPAQGPDQASLAIPLIVKGDWAAPEIYPDIESALKDKESLAGTAKLFGKSVEKLTDGKIKADDFGKMIDGLFGKKKKDKEE